METHIYNAEQHSSDTIDSIIERDLAAFAGYASAPDHFQTLPADSQPLRYLGIPRRILELAKDPAAVDLKILPAMAGEFSFLVYEKRAEVLSDEELLTYQMWYKEYLAMRGDFVKGYDIWKTGRESEVSQMLLKCMLPVCFLPMICLFSGLVSDRKKKSL